MRDPYAEIRAEYPSDWTAAQSEAHQAPVREEEVHPPTAYYKRLHQFPFKFVCLVLVHSRSFGSRLHSI